MGGAWGVVDAQGRLKDGRAGALPVDFIARGALVGLGVGALLMVLGGGLLLARGHQHRRRLVLNRAALALWVCAAGTAALLMGHHLGGLTIWLRSPWEWGLAVITALMALWVTMDALVHSTAACLTAPSPTAYPLHAHERANVLPVRLPLADQARLLLFFLMAWQALNLIFDGRYRPLPASLHLMPAIALCSAHGLMRPLPSSSAQGLLGTVLLVGAPVLMFLEGPTNLQAWGVAIAWIMLGSVTWMKPDHRAVGRRSDGPPDSDKAISSNAPSKAAAADRSVS